MERLNSSSICRCHFCFSSLVRVSETYQPSQKAASVAGLIFRRSRLSPIVTSDQCRKSLRIPASLATGADLRPSFGRRYLVRRVLFGFSDSGARAYQSRWNDSPLASPWVLAAMQSRLAVPWVSWESPWDVAPIWRTPLDLLAVSALGYRRRQAD